MDNIPISPIEALVMERFKGHTFTQETYLNASVTNTQILKNNPNRVGWIIINEGTYDVKVSPTNYLSAYTGWLLPANGGVISMNWKDDGEGVSQELYAVTVASVSALRIREVIRS